MYDYDFSNEKVINEAMTINIKYNNKYYLTNILLTQKNILFFIDENKDNFLKGSGVQVLPEFVLLVKYPTDKIKFKENENETIINNELNIYNFDLKEFLKDIKIN